MTSRMAGLLAEYAALILLVFKGYMPLRHRLPLRTGEVDWVMRRGRTLVIVEVKWRGKKEDVETALRGFQLGRLRRSILLLSHRYAWATAVRLDFILCYPWGMIHRVNIGGMS